MYASKSIVLVLTLGCVLSANADVLESWGDGSQGTDWDWIPQENTLTILRGNGNDYRFWVHDGSEDPGTGVIDNITVDIDATGDFSILIEHPDGYAGALDWNEGDLRYAGGTSTTIGAKIVKHLGEAGKEVIIDRLEGSLEVGDWVWDVVINEWSSLSPGTITIGDRPLLTRPLSICSVAHFAS
ncbi:MAG: hypothetical protein ACE5I3_09450 [Phycisphaerae bacterium]